MSEDVMKPTAAPIIEMSDDISALAKVLPKAQSAMGEVFKNANNPAFKSKYADLAAVVEAVLPALNASGIALLQPSAYDNGTGIVHVATMLMHESGQWMRCTLAMPLSKRDAHGVGSAVTYGRRFGLQAMSGVAPTDDDGNEAAKPQQERAEAKRADPKPPTLAERADRLETTLKNVKPEEIDKAWELGAALLALLSVEMPDRLAELTTLYEFRRPEQKEAA